MKDIIQLSTGSSNVLLVSLPEDAINCSVFYEEGYNPVLDVWFAGGYPNVPEKAIELPPGNWIEVGWSDSLTEDQVKGFVKRSGFKESSMRWFNYKDDQYTCSTALESWQSFLSANNIKERKFVLRDNK